MAALKHVIDAYGLVEKKFNELFMAEQKLSRLASEATGVGMTAQMCGDGEIDSVSMTTMDCQTRSAASASRRWQKW